MAFVSGGKIIAIGKVKHDDTLDGDGVLEPLTVIGGGGGGGFRYNITGGTDIKVDEQWNRQTSAYDVKISYSGTKFTKADADKLYQPKGNYAKVGDSYTKTESDGKYQAKGNYVKSEDFTPWKTSVENSAANISGYIKTHEEQWSKGNEYTAGTGIDATKIANNEIALIATSAKKINDAITKADLNGYATEKWVTDKNYHPTSSFNEWKTEDYDVFKSEYDTFSGKITQSAENISAYITANEEKWSKDTDTKYSNGVGITISGANNSINLNAASAKKINDAITKADLNGYATETWVSGQKYATSAWVDSNFVKPAALNDYYKKTETSGKEEIADALSKLQPVGHYVTSGGFTNWVDTEYSAFKNDYSTFSGKTVNDIAYVSGYASDVSSYINSKETEWEIDTNTTYTFSGKGGVKVSSAYNSTTDRYTITVSAEQQPGAKEYTAGDWIDSKKLEDDNIISVSGYKNIYVDSPLYWTDESDGYHLHCDSEGPVTKNKAILLVNSYPGTFQTDGISATAPNDVINGEYVFKFDRSMSVLININANFIPNSIKYKDYYDTVGFSGTDVTNKITYTQFGFAPNYYACSTVTQIPDNPTGQVAEMRFKFIPGTEYPDFTSNIQNPVIAVTEL